MERFSLEGKVAIVTGAASGIGYAIAQAFLEANIAGITLVDLSLDSLERARTRLSPSSQSRIHIVAADCSTEQGTQDYISSTLSRFDDRLDISVQCAGVCPPARSIVDTPVQQFEHVMNVNVRGVWLGCRDSFKAMTREPRNERRDKNILVISSQIGLDGQLFIS